MGALAKLSLDLSLSPDHSEVGSLLCYQFEPQAALPGVRGTPIPVLFLPSQCFLWVLSAPETYPQQRGKVSRDQAAAGIGPEGQASALQDC